MKKANVYIFDEPTSYLDIRQRINVSKFIRELADENTAVLIAEHDLIILDYMRFYNIYYLFSGNFFRRLFNFMNKKNNQYYFGRLGLKKYLQEKNDLIIEDIQSFYTSPPFFKSKKLAILFENTLGVLFKPFLARVIILKLRNIK